MLRALSALKLALSLIAVAMLGSGHLGAAANPSAPDREVVESVETRTALNTLVKQNEVLRQKLKDSEETGAGLQKNLFIANSERELLTRQVSELRLRLEAVGASANPDERLIAALGALDDSEKQKTALANSVIALSDCLEKVRATDEKITPETRAMVEAAVRQGKKALVPVQGEEATAEQSAVASIGGEVIAIKDDLALIVTNLGREGGAKVGMPFRVLRGDRTIGKIQIVDVRDRISGAVIVELISDGEKICLGDKLKIGAMGQM